MNSLHNRMVRLVCLLLVFFLCGGLGLPAYSTADTISAGESNQLLGFSYGTNGRDVTDGETYYYVENSLAKAIISRKTGNNNAQGTFQKGWLADVVLKDSAKKETLDWSEFVLSKTLEAGWGFGVRDLELSSISIQNSEKIVAAGSWLTDPSINATVTYRMIPDAPIIKVTLHLENNGTNDFNGYFEYLLDPDGSGAQNSYVPGKGWDTGLTTSGWNANYIYSGAKTTTTGFPAHGIAWQNDQPVALNAQNYICGVWFDAAVKAGMSKDITFYHITAYPAAAPAAVNQSIADWAARIGELDQEAVTPVAQVTGHVTDSVTGTGVSGVKIVAKDINAATVATRFSNSTGAYQMQLPIGTYTLTGGRLAYNFVSRSLEVAGTEPYSLDLLMQPVTAWAGTGKTLNGSLVEGTETDLVLENQRIAMGIAKTFNDPQLSGSTKGKPVDFAIQGLTDAIDWMNVPYLSAVQPTGTEAWQILKVSNTTAEVVESTANRAVVRTTGVYADVAGVTVSTTYTIEPDTSWIYAESLFTNASGQDVTVWAGDVIDLDESTQVSHVAGVGDITTAYANPASYTPTAPWMGMYGSTAQAFGIIYHGDYAQNFSAYGNGNWIQSQKQIVIPNGGSYQLSRYLVAVSTDGYAQKMEAVGDVYTSLVASRLGVTASDMTVTPSTGLMIGSSASVSLQIHNETDAIVDGVTAAVQIPGIFSAGAPLDVTLPSLPPHGSHTLVWPLTAQAGGSGFINVAVAMNGQTIFSKSAKLFVNGPGWYAGDNHGHTKYSDGSGTVHDNFVSARNKGLSFLTATDHNSINQQADVALENSEDFVALFGEEVTSSYGHSLAYNISALVDWKLSPQAMIDSVKSQNGGKSMLFIAHPYYPGLEWDDWSVTNYDGIEVWNGFYAPKHSVNAQAFALWDDFNRQGRRLVGIANSDAHNPGKIGDPRIKAYLPALSQENIYDALRKGTLFGTNGPDLRLTVLGQAMGSDLYIPPTGSTVQINVSGSYAQGVTGARLIKNGTTIATWNLTGTDMQDSVTDQAVAGDFYRFELDGANNGFAFSNPVWIKGYTDLSSQLRVTTSAMTYNRATKTYNGNLTVTNTSQSPLSGPFVIWLNNLASGITLANGNGLFNGYPHIDPAAPQVLNPGESTTVALKFSNSSNAKITFTPVVFNGAAGN